MVHFGTADMPTDGGSRKRKVHELKLKNHLILIQSPTLVEKQNWTKEECTQGKQAEAATGKETHLS